MGDTYRYGNASGDGEYAHECLLRCPKASSLQCMPKPIMSHQRNRYVVFKDRETGQLALRQVRVSPHDYVSSASMERPTKGTGCSPLSGDVQGGAWGVQRGGKNKGF